jgi:hypothetical protein
MLDGEVKLALRRLVRALQAVAGGVVEPTVVGAGNPPLLDPAVEQ